MGFLWHLANSTALLVWDLIQFTIWFLTILATVSIATGTVFYAMGFVNVQMLATGYLLMPLAESEASLGGQAVGVAGQIQDVYNDFFVELANDVIPCGDAIGDVWNRVMAFVLGVVRRFANAFGIETPQWDQYRRYGDTPGPLITQREFLVRMAEELEKEAFAGNSTGGSWQTQARALEAKARLLAIRIAKTLDPKGERMVSSRFVSAICNVLRTIFDVLIDLLVNFIEFVLMVADFIIEILGPAFDSDVLTFAQVLVKIIINIILDILDPCNCFGNDFPDNFPRSIFKCICFFEYKSDADVPDNVLNALVGCVCPGFDVNGNVYSDMIVPCFRIDILEFLLNLINIGINIVNTIIAGIVSVYNWIIGQLGAIWGAISSLFDFFRRSEGRMCGPNQWCTYEVIDEEYRVHVTMRKFDNTTGEEISSVTRSFDNEALWQKNLREFEASNPVGMTVETALADFEVIRQRTSDRLLFTHLAMQLNQNYMDEMMHTFNHTLERGPPRPIFMPEGFERGLPDFPCPLPIDPGDDRRAERIALGVTRWKERASMVRNYFLAGIADRIHYAAAKVAFDLHNLTMNPNAFGERMKTPSSAPDFANVLVMFRGLTAVFFDVMTATEVPTVAEVAKKLEHVPVEDGLQSMRRTANAIREYHGADIQPLYDVKMDADVKMTAMFDPVALPRIARRYGQIPENLPSLERHLDALEKQLDGVDAARAQLDAGNRDEAVRVLRNQVLGDRMMRFTDLLSGRNEDPAARAIGATIGIGIAAGGAITIGVGVVLGLAVVAAPLIGLLLVLLAVLIIPIMGVLIELGTTGINTLLDNGTPAGFDPVASFFSLLGPIFLDSFTTDAPTQQDLSDLMLDILNLLVDDLEYIFLLMLRLLLTLIFPLVRPPAPAWDPASGASADSLTGYIFDRINCENNVPCLISAGEKFGDSLGECGCFFQIGNDFFSRRGTFEEPCDGNAGEFGVTICYPFWRPGRFIPGINVIPGSAPECENYGYNKDAHLIPRRASWGQLLGTWWDNWKATTILLGGLFANGATIPIVGLGAYVVQAACPCFRPLAGLVWRWTLRTQILALFYPEIATWFRVFLFSNRGLWIVGPWFESAVPFFTPTVLDFDRGYCAVMYSGPWFVMFGILTTVLPPLSIAAVLYFPLAAWFVWRIALWPVNTVIWIVWWMIVEARSEAGKMSKESVRKSLRRNTWDEPFITSQTPQRLTDAILPQ